METTHIAQNINVSLRKVRTLIPAVRKLNPVVALTRLRHMQQSGARALADAIQTALANGENTLKVTRDMLEFRRLSADQGIVMKRYRAGSRGTAQPILRRMTHITVILAVTQAPRKAPDDKQKDAGTKDVVQEAKATQPEDVARSKPQQKSPRTRKSVKSASPRKKVQK